MTKKDEDNGLIIGRLSDKRDESFLLSGVSEFDELTGGFARGRITELWGTAGVGKTHLATKLMANLSNGNKVLYIDSEFALNKARVASLGADPKNIAYVADSRLEKVCELLVANVDKFDVIILDSLAFLTPMTVANAEIGERSIGLFALLIKHWVLKFRPALASSKTAFIALNQYRPPIGLYAVESPPGGMSWQHACDVRIKLTTTSSDKIKEGTTQVGHWVHATIKKNKMGAVGLETKFKLIY